MAMSRKHYKRAAEIIAAARPAETMPDEWRAGCQSAVDLIADELADMFAADNPNFNRHVFMDACKGEP